MQKLLLGVRDKLKGKRQKRKINNENASIHGTAGHSMICSCSVLFQCLLEERYSDS